MSGEAPAPLSRHRLWIFRLIAVGVPLLVGGALIVVTLMVQERLVFDAQTGWPRLQSPPVYVQEPGSERTGHRYLYDSLLGWKNIPNWRASTRGRKLSINSKGLRGREYDYTKQPGTSRILVLGDSFGWGYGVADEEVLAAVLEQQLQRDGLDWEVLNGGVSGWGTDQEYLFLTSEGFKYAPDIVVLAFLVFNDPANNSSTVQYGLHKPVFLNSELELAGVPVPLPDSDVPQLTISADPLDVTLAIVHRLSEACAEHVVRQLGADLGAGRGPH